MSNNQIYIVDQSTKFLFADQPQQVFITSKEELDLAVLTNENSSAIIILAELDWSEPSELFYGFNIATDLRRKNRLLSPIIIVSSFPREWFEHYAEKDVKYNMMFSRGALFLHIADIAEKLQYALQSVFPLTPPVLSDVNDMLLNARGVIIDRLTHDLRPTLTVDQLHNVLSELSVYLTKQQQTQTGWLKFEQELLSSLGMAEDFYLIKQELLLRCEQVLSDFPLPKTADPLRKHRIIILEDDQEFRHQITENLLPFFEELIVTGEATKAIQHLDNDHSNSILALVADWRLYADPGKRYWQIQGYEVLAYAAKTRLIALFSLTSLSDQNVHSIRNMMGLDIHLFKKNHFLEPQTNLRWAMMADAIHQKCDEMLEIISAQPTGSGWEKLKPEYFQKRSSGWKLFEFDIDSQASNIFSYYRAAIDSDDHRNVYGLGEMGLATKNNLKNILIVRRVYLGLYFLLTKRNIYLQDIRPAKLLGEGDNFDTELKHHSVDAYSLMRKDWWDDLSTGVDSVDISDEWGKFEQRQKNLRSSLGIELGVLPARGMLPEERGWLTKNNIDFSFFFDYWSTD